MATGNNGLMRGAGPELEGEANTEDHLVRQHNLNSRVMELGPKGGGAPHSGWDDVQ